MEETSFERVIENVNVSRTLNFVFRQVNQEFISLYHLTDVRIAYVRDDVTMSGESRPAYREASLAQLGPFLEQVIDTEEHRAAIQTAIEAQLDNSWDYADVHHSFITRSKLEHDPT
jgi:hypothetical protein